VQKGCCREAVVQNRPLQNWRICANLLNYPPHRLTSCHPIWSNLSPVDTNTLWNMAISSCNQSMAPTNNNALSLFAVHSHCWTISTLARVHTASLDKHGSPTAPDHEPYFGLIPSCTLTMFKVNWWLHIHMLASSSGSIYPVVQKTRSLWSFQITSIIIFCAENLQTISNVHICTWRADKTGYQLRLIP